MGRRGSAALPNNTKLLPFDKMNTFLLTTLLTSCLLLPLFFLLALSSGKRGVGGERKGEKGKRSFIPRRLRPFSPLHLCSCSMLALVLLAPLANALDVQPLPLETQSRNGFNYAARITWADLDNSDNACTIIPLYPIPTNCYVDRVGFYIEENFTNSTASATNLLLCIGVGGSTNAFFTTNQVDGSDTMALAGLTVWGLSTNMLVPYKSTTSTNYLVATLSAASSVVDTYTRGKLAIYFHVVRPAGIKF